MWFRRSRLRWLPFAAGFVASLLAGPALEALGVAAGPQRALWVGLAIELGWACLAGCIASLASAPPLAEGLGWRRGRLDAWGLVLAIFGLLVLSVAIDALLAEIALREGGRLGEIDDSIARTVTPHPVLVFAALGVAPGFGEELLFRGAIQEALARRFRPVVAITAAAALFALAHADPVHAAAALVPGLYLGTVAWLAGSVRAAIGCHVANNCFALALEAGFVAFPAPGGIVAIGAAFVIAFGSLAATATRRRAAPEAPPAGQ